MSDDNGKSDLMDNSWSSQGRQKRVSSEDTRERKRRWEREKRIRDRIRIGREYSRWATLRKTLGTDKNETVAKLLLDAWYCRGSVFCSRCAATIHFEDAALDTNRNPIPTLRVTQDRSYSNTANVDSGSGEGRDVNTARIDSIEGEDDETGRVESDDEGDTDSSTEDNGAEMFLCDKPDLHTDSATNHGQEKQKNINCEKQDNGTVMVEPVKRILIVNVRDMSAHSPAGSSRDSEQRSATPHHSSTTTEASLVENNSPLVNTATATIRTGNTESVSGVSARTALPEILPSQSMSEKQSENLSQRDGAERETETSEKIFCIKKEPLYTGYEPSDDMNNFEYPVSENILAQIADGKESQTQLPPVVYPIEDSLVLNCAGITKSLCDAGVQREELTDSGTQTEYDVDNVTTTNNEKRSRGRPRKSFHPQKVTRAMNEIEQKNKHQSRQSVDTRRDTTQVKKQKIIIRRGRKKKIPVKRPRPKVEEENDWEWELSNLDNDEEEELPVAKKHKKKDDDPDFEPNKNEESEQNTSDCEDESNCRQPVRDSKKYSNFTGRRKNGRFCKQKIVIVVNKPVEAEGMEAESSSQKVSIKEKGKKQKSFKVPKRPYIRRMRSETGELIAQKKKYEDITVKLEEHKDKYEMTTYTSQAKSDRSLDMALKSYSRFTCKLCNGTYNTRDKSYMEEHIKYHLQGRLTCKECGKTFSTIQNMREHNARIHKIRDFICEMCAQSFCSLKTLNHHLSSIHDEKPFKCLKCTERFSSNSTMREHMYEIHPGSVIKCEVCDGIFASKKTLGFHQASANCRNQANKVPEKIPCEQCGKLVIRMRMSTHIQRAHLKIHTFKCDKCPYTASTSCRIKFHMMTHTGEHPYRCDMCTFSCIKPSQLKCHMRTHTGDKPYKCDLCSYASAWNVQLKGHKKAHDSPVKVDCKQCNITFKDDRGLSLHTKKEHCEDTATGESRYRTLKQCNVNNFYKKDRTNMAATFNNSQSVEQRIADIYKNEQQTLETDMSYRPKTIHYQKRDDSRQLDLSELEMSASYLYRPFMNL